MVVGLIVMASLIIFGYIVQLPIGRNFAYQHQLSSVSDVLELDTSL